MIARNAGEEGSVVLNAVLGGKDDFGFNAATMTYENLIQSGVIDPTKVVRFALQNAASVAGLMITTEAMIANKPKKDNTMFSRVNRLQLMVRCSAYQSYSLQSCFPSLIIFLIFCLCVLYKFS